MRLGVGRASRGDRAEDAPNRLPPSGAVPRSFLLLAPLIDQRGFTRLPLAIQKKRIKKTRNNSRG